MKEMKQLSESERGALEMYLQLFQQRLEKDPASLTPHEKRLGEKFKTVKEEAVQVAKDIDQLRNQIQQAQARLNSAELELQARQGRARGILDAIVELEMLRVDQLTEMKGKLENLEKSRLEPTKGEALPPPQAVPEN